MDHPHRSSALTLNQSFIVQAPAGSGKTELLIQRYLALLGQVVKEPEEILAITFTQKAAFEMKDRILKALHQPTAERTAKLAEAVRAQDQKNNWHLLDNPHRLRIQTIDALARQIATGYPHLSPLGASEPIAETPFAFYREAARQVPWTFSLETLLFTLHNLEHVAESLIAELLARREQWLPWIMPFKGKKELRKELEASLSRVSDACIQKVTASLPSDLLDEMLALVRYSHSDTDTPTLWKEIASLFLTQDHEWRKQISEREGFPSAAHTQNQDEKAFRLEMKKRFKNVVGMLAECPEMRELLLELKMLPNARYKDDEWQLLEALFELLPTAVAALMVIFKEQRKVDFTEVHLSAERILNNEEGPSDLTLFLDYKIQHILVDEFQDTSLSQGRLLEHLTAGWQPGDGRTLFLVGDPMQSIYRFRQAEVGLFLDAQKRSRFGSIEMEPLVLTQNFRASPPLVDWNNQVFKTLFPKKPQFTLGGVPFTPSECPVDTLNSPLPHAREGQEPALCVAKGVRIFSDKQEEALHIVQTIQAILNQHPKDTSAILVRARTHLTSILPALTQAEIPYQAIEIEPLASCRTVQDCLALTVALIALSDRTAWFALLRAPWCGVPLHDLWAITQKAGSGTLWEALLSFETLETLSEHTRNRLSQIVPILRRAIEERCRVSLRQRIENTWSALGGPACCSSLHELKQADTYFAHLEAWDWKCHDNRLTAFKESLKTLFAEPPLNMHSPLQVMTIHRAKGLEFDHVLLPSLEKKTAGNDPPLMLWTEQKTDLGTSNFILGPIKQKGDKADSIYTYLRFLEAQKNAHETKRLLYVAMTRAKKSLHLSATAPASDEKPWTPSEGSFLAMLWPWCTPTSVHSSKEAVEPKTSSFSPFLKRLSLDWQLSKEIPLNPPFSKGEENGVSPLKKGGRGDFLPQQIGTLTHRILKTIAQDGIEHWPLEKLEQKKIGWRFALQRMGVETSQCDFALNTVLQAITNTLQDERGQWILSHRHNSAGSEFALTKILKTSFSTEIIDRWFQDQEGRIWIVDYKLTENPELAQKEYAEQLNRYAETLSGFLKTNVRVGLYFPLIPTWIEWEPIALVTPCAEPA